MRQSSDGVQRQLPPIVGVGKSAETELLTEPPTWLPLASTSSESPASGDTRPVRTRPDAQVSCDAAHQT
jgi:hypothetical protein